MIAHRSDTDCLRAVATTAGLAWSTAFIALALGYELQMYADGSIFSYAVAVRDVWAFHWHNIVVRAFVYLYSMLPAEAYVALTADPRGGIFVYGILFYAAQAVGLTLTFATDRSRGRIVFVYACASTACLLPLVFGFPTEMWLTHALFWPALSACHFVRRTALGAIAVFALLLALVFTHEGGVLFAIAILITLALRGWRAPALWRAAAAFIAAMAVWAAVRLAFPPDPYFASIITRAALSFIDLGSLASPVFLLLIAALTAYAIAFLIVQRLRLAHEHIIAAVVVAAGLAVYWLFFDRALHTQNRYYLRTALLIGTPILGAFAACYVMRAERAIALNLPLLPRVLKWFDHAVLPRALIGAIAIVTLVHVVETAKFVTAWSGYKKAVQALAMGTASDPALGNVRFVSSARIGTELNRLSWFSTTPYLSVLLAPGFAPKRLVVDPHDSYFWLSCVTASANAQADRAVPVASRRLIRDFSCLHRPR